MTASDHKKRREGSRVRTPGEQVKAAAVNDSGNSRYRPHQSSVGRAASGQKTANETIHAHSVVTA